MSLADYKITDSDISTNGVVAAPDKLTGTAAENKRIFDRLIRESVKELYNGLIDALTTISNQHFKNVTYNAETNVLTFTKENNSTKTVTIITSEVARLYDATTEKYYDLTMDNGRIVLEEV